jgi:hypothetical protein
MAFFPLAVLSDPEELDIMRHLQAVLFEPVKEYMA